ncbi:MAG: alkaline phosphatase [Alphaproteobacteria bacterium]|nr:alkaline phosphatase [Alphaproteobacteria bacterium]
MNIRVSHIAAAMVCALATLSGAAHAGPRSAIFLHPDGMGANTWTAVRLKEAGPDGRLAWDKLPNVALYTGPLADSVTATSNGGATSHAWGVRAQSDSFGMIDGARIPRAASGADAPLLIEAKRAGKAIGLVNTASITDAGTGAQVAVVRSRKEHAEIAAQMLAADVDVLLGGGEQYFLPAGVKGVHGVGVRTDGRNLIEEARARGYRVVRTRAEFQAALKTPGKLLGLFAADATFEEGTEEALAGRPVFAPDAPRYDELVAGAVALLRGAPRGYLLVAEEEATDNLAGDNHAAGVLEAATGADRAIAIVLAEQARNRDLTLVVASDSDCGGMQATGDDVVAGQPLPRALPNGAPLDGIAGAGTPPFLAAPDRAGRRLPFAIAWASDGDMSGGGVVRAAGPGARYVQGTLDSTDIYTVLHASLFGGRAPRAP